MSTLLTAARSYYGLADTKVVESELVSQAGTYITFRIEVTDEDLAGILARMKTMQEQAPAEVIDLHTDAPGWTREELREQYNALSPQERSQYGAFHRYEAWRRGMAMDAVISGEGAGGRKIVHVDAPEEESAKPPAVWVDNQYMVEYQKPMASEYDEVNARWLLQEVMLTPEQRARYVQPGEQHE